MSMSGSVRYTPLLRLNLRLKTDLLIDESFFQVSACRSQQSEKGAIAPFLEFHVFVSQNFDV